MPGSVGPKGPAHIFKGMRMGGRMGKERVTIQNLSIAAIDVEKNILYIKGAVPGANDGLLLIKGEGELIFKAVPVVEESKAEEIKVEETPVEESKTGEVLTEAAPVNGIKEEAPAV